MGERKKDEDNVSDQGTLPFATATIARLYMAQGNLAQAEALFRRLLEDNPDDPRLMAGLSEVERRRRSGDQPLTADRVELRSSGDKLLCTWHITEEALQRARSLLQGSGRIILRLIAFPQGPDQSPADAALEGLQGTMELDPLPRAALIAAAVGILAEERFHSIAHCTFSPKG